MTSGKPESNYELSEEERVLLREFHEDSSPDSWPLPLRIKAEKETDLVGEIKAKLAKFGIEGFDNEYSYYYFVVGAVVASVTMQSMTEAGVSPLSSRMITLAQVAGLAEEPSAPVHHLRPVD